MTFVFIPIYIALFFSPFWQLLSDRFVPLVAFPSFVLNLLLNPVYLLILLVIFGIKCNVSLLLCMPVCIAVNLLAVLVEYWNMRSRMKQLKKESNLTYWNDKTQSFEKWRGMWGMGVRRFEYPPDYSDIRFICWLQIIVSTLILGIGSIIISIVKWAS